MNKILFKLIEGKGKFFLGRNWPVWNPEKCHTNLQCESESERSKEQFCGCWNEYNRAINECISEALKNGEIVNPEVIPEDWLNPLLKDGETILPEGMGFEVVYNTLPEGQPEQAIRLIPEKPVQKEESQEELFFDLEKRTKHGTLHWSQAHHYFTIKRKDS